MSVKKKRASYSKTPHIAVQAQVSSLEDDQPVEENPQDAITSDPSDRYSSRASMSNQEVTSVQEAPQTDSLEEMLANDAVESALTKKNRWLYMVGILATACIILSTIVLYGVYRTSSSAPVVSTTPESTPTPVPTVTVDVKTLSIEVLNGSGIAGKASKTAEALKEKGYMVVSTGNAKKIPNTTVSFSSTISQRAREIILSDLQSLGQSSISSTLADSSISARIILGLK